MKKVAVITDSNSGITQSEAKKLGIHVVPMPFFVNGDTFYEDISMSQDEFYGYLAQGADVMTSQPAPDTLMKLWDRSSMKNPLFRVCFALLWSPLPICMAMIGAPP